MGEVGLALVVPAADAGSLGEDELTAWARERLANYKVPRSVRWVDGFPMNAGGKVLKRQLRLQYAPVRGESHERSSAQRVGGRAPVGRLQFEPQESTREGGLPCEASSIPVTRRR